MCISVKITGPGRRKYNPVVYKVDNYTSGGTKKKEETETSSHSSEN